MLGVEILPGEQAFPTIPKMEFPGVQIGPQRDWSQAVGVGALLGAFAGGLTIAILARRKR